MEKIKSLLRKAYNTLFRRKNKRRYDLYVHGNLVSYSYVACRRKPAGIECNVPYEDVDLNYGIIIEGDMVVDNLYTKNKIVGASGYICGCGAMDASKQSLYSDGFVSASNKR